jgi:hypothetical protein
MVPLHHRGFAPLLARLAPWALLAALVAPAAADPLAVLAACKGKVQVAHGAGPARPASFGAALDRGDRIVVPAGGAATVFFNDGNVVELAEKSAITIGGQVSPRTSLTPAGELSSEVYSSVSRFATGGSARTGYVAMSRVRGGPGAAPLLLAPRNTAVLTSRPDFTWSAVEGATRYRVTVNDPEGRELWSRESSGFVLAYPADADSLAPGADYECRVQALSDHGPLRQESGPFEVLASADAAAVRASLERIRVAAGAESPAAQYLAGSYLFEHGLLGDAARHFQALASLSPQSPVPHRALSQVYRGQNLMEQAFVERDRADALAPEP